jgi:hypothetical protein
MGSPVVDIERAETSAEDLGRLPAQLNHEVK